jgi:hypothetical protein
MSAAVCRAMPLRRIGKLTFKTVAGCKRPLHLSRIIHIDVPYRRDKNRLQNKKRAPSAGAERPFFYRFSPLFNSR